MLVLLVEDDPAVQASVRRRLAFEGFTVETAERGDQVLEQVRLLNPQVVILDVMLPEMDGFEGSRPDQWCKLPLNALALFDV